MANRVFTKWRTAEANGTFVIGTADLRIVGVMTNTTADTEDPEFVSGFTTLDEFDGANYTRVALANELVREDLANNRVEIDADDVTGAWTALGNGTRQMAGLLLIAHITNDAASRPLAYVDTLSGATTLPFDPAGATINFTFNAEGILQK